MSIENEIKNINSISKDIEYLKGEMSGALWAKRGFDGEVDAITFLEFVIKHDYMVEHFMLVAKRFKELTE